MLKEEVKMRDWCHKKEKKYMLRGKLVQRSRKIVSLAKNNWSEPFT